MLPPRLAGARALALGALLASGCTLDAIGAFEAASTSAAMGGGGSGAGTAVATSTGFGGSDRPIETDCTNGLDDDADGAVDCDDGDCRDAGFRCLDEVPGALGYAYAMNEGACAEAWAAEPRGDCSTGCSCNGTDGTCVVEADSYGGSGCGDYRATVSGTGCLNLVDGYRSFKVRGLTQVEGTCVPSPGPAFAPAARTICRVELEAVGVCGASSVCLPPVPDVPLCAVLPASSACGPSFIDRGVLANEDGSCTCACERGVPTCPGAKLDTYRWSDFCEPSNADVDIPADGQCHDAGETWSLSLSQFAEQAPCTPTSAPAAPETAVRLCCEPPPN